MLFAILLARLVLTMASKTVLLKYEEHRKKVMIPAEKDTSDLAFLESSFRQAFNFEKQVNLTISFQRYDADFDELVDMEDGDEIQHLEKLNVVVTPVLVTPSAVSVPCRCSKDQVIQYLCHLQSSTQSSTCEDATSQLSEDKACDESPLTTVSRKRAPRRLHLDTDSENELLSPVVSLSALLCLGR